MNKEFFGDEKDKPCKKQGQGYQAVMVFFITMVQGIRTDAERKPDHGTLKEFVFDDIDTK